MPEPSLFKLWSQAVVRKAASLMFPRESFRFDSLIFGPGRTTYNYAADVQDGLASSVVMPVVQWLMRSFPEAPLVVRAHKGDELEVVDAHPLVQLVNRPNAFYPGTILWMATITDWSWFGESYWRILRARGGQPVELWWIPPWSIKPKWPDDGSVYISHYDYQPSIGTPIRLEIEEIIHFRHGLDPRNMRHGLPPLRAILQDIWVDAESNNFVGAMLRNMGIPGLILSPKGEGYLSQADVEQVKAYIQSRFTGDQRGQPLALGSPTDVHKLSLSPTELDMSMLRGTAEERVCAALGIPVAVVGFKSGLENSKVGATMHEFVGLAWSNGIVPMQRLMADELQRTLLPLFEPNPDQLLVGWDYDEVKALEPDQNALAKRAVELYQGGVLMRAEARQLMGYEANDGDEIYLVPSSMTEEGPDAPEPEPLPAALPAVQGANGNGTSQGNGRQVAAVARGLVGLQASLDITNRIGFVHEHVPLVLGHAEVFDDADEVTLKQGTLEELVTGIIGRSAGHMNPIPPHLLRLVARFARREQALQPQFQRALIAVFERYGDMVATAAREVLAPKQSLQDVISTSVILERMPLASVQADLTREFERMYTEMFKLTEELLVVSVGAEMTNPERIQHQLSMLARERVGLMDLPKDARTSILKTLEQARAEGFSEDEMVNFLRTRVPAGRWGSIETRARVIARTESRYGANLATAAYARDAGVGQVLVLDARLGPTDAECTARNGWVVTPSQAQALSGVEHPNGTLALLPMTPQVMTPPTPPVPVTLDSVMKAGRRLDAEWQKALGHDYATMVQRRDELETRRVELRDQYDRLRQGQSTIAERDVVWNERMQVSRELDTLTEQLPRQQRQTLHTVLSKVRPLGEVEAQWTPTTRDEITRSIRDVSKSLPRDWLQRSRDAGAMDGQLASDGRGYYWSVKNEIRLSGAPISPERTSNAFHEFGHRFEEVVPKVFEMEDEFYKARTARDIPKNRLQKLGPGYADDEMTRPDRFVEPYMGKEYPRQRNYELLSMGLESVFTGSYDLSKDPEFRRFILGVLATV